MSDDKYFDLTKLKIRKDKESKTRKLYGNVSINTEMDNSYKETILLYKKQGGEYRKMPYKIPDKGICDLFNEGEYIYPELVAHSDFPNPMPCPLPAVSSFSRINFIEEDLIISFQRIYEIRGFQPSLKNVPNMVLPTGDYAIECTILKDGEVGFKARFYVSIIRI